MFNTSLFRRPPKRWPTLQLNSAGEHLTEYIYIFRQVCPIFLCERQTFGGSKKWPAPKERLSFKPKYWANLFKYIFFVLFSCLLLHRLATRISLPISIFSSYYCTDLVYSWEIRPVNGLSLWTCWYFILAHILIHPLAKIWHIVPSSTGCAGNLNRKDRIAKVRILTAMRGTSWQSIVDGTRWKRVLS